MILCGITWNDIRGTSRIREIDWKMISKDVIWMLDRHSHSCSASAEEMVFLFSIIFVPLSPCSIWVCPVPSIMAHVSNYAMAFFFNCNHRNGCNDASRISHRFMVRPFRSRRFQWKWAAVNNCNSCPRACVPTRVTADTAVQRNATLSAHVIITFHIPPHQPDEKLKKSTSMHIVYNVHITYLACELSQFVMNLINTCWCVRCPTTVDHVIRDIPLRWWWWWRNIRRSAES